MKILKPCWLLYLVFKEQKSKTNVRIFEDFWVITSIIRPIPPGLLSSYKAVTRKEGFLETWNENYWKESDESVNLSVPQAWSSLARQTIFPEGTNLPWITISEDCPWGWLPYKPMLFKIQIHDPSLLPFL